MRIDGLKELDKALGELGKRVGKATLRKAIKAASVPVINDAQALAPVDDGTLKASIIAGTKLGKAQRKLQNKESRANGGKATAEIYIGPTAPHAHLVEFGTAPHVLYRGIKHPGTQPQPFMRPAFEQNQEKMMEIMKQELIIQINKALARQAKRNSKGK